MQPSDDFYYGGKVRLGYEASATYVRQNPPGGMLAVSKRSAVVVDITVLPTMHVKHAPVPKVLLVLHPHIVFHTNCLIRYDSVCTCALNWSLVFTEINYHVCSLVSDNVGLEAAHSSKQVRSPTYSSKNADIMSRCSPPILYTIVTYQEERKSFERKKVWNYPL
jgi:hypothetical protein